MCDLLVTNRQRTGLWAEHRANPIPTSKDASAAATSPEPKEILTLALPHGGAAHEGAGELLAPFPGMLPQHPCSQGDAGAVEVAAPRRSVAESCHMVPLQSRHQPARSRSRVFRSPGGRVKRHVRAGASGLGWLFLSLKRTAL